MKKGRTSRLASKPGKPDASHGGGLKDWLTRRPWMAGCDLKVEKAQAYEEGRDLSSVEKDLDRLIRSEKKFEFHAERLALVDRVGNLPRRKNHEWPEPNDLKSIRAARPKPLSLRSWKGSEKEMASRVHGALLGRMAGCLLGKPVECWRRDKIQSAFTVTGNWPIRDYLRPLTASEIKRADLPAFARDLAFWKNLRGQLRGGIDGMVEDDDINYTFAGWGVMREHGSGFTSLDILDYWCRHLPYFHTCTAELAAYRNVVQFIMPPETATFRNPYREWIGAQIRADFFGYASPGKPAQAAMWAWRDAAASHVKNGIYGEIWVAAMLAAAYVETDWKKIIKAGLGEIPGRCRLRKEIESVMSDHQAGVDYDEAVTRLHLRWNEADSHHWCHTISNAAVVVIGLLYGEDDFEKTITRAVMPGFDTDCNGATCGSLWGIKHGVNALPKKWTAPLKNRVRTGVAEYQDVKISDVASAMVKTILEVNQPGKQRRKS